MIVRFSALGLVARLRRHGTACRAASLLGEHSRVLVNR
jgi:hypothetical protein